MLSDDHQQSASLIRSGPPPLPPDATYTNCYCEENVYLLAQMFQALATETDDWPWAAHAIFISNETKTVALWGQKARKDIVVWDYHVVLVLQPREPCRHRNSNEAAHAGTWVYDFDSRLPNPCPGLDYIHGTFPYAFDRQVAAQVPQQFHSLFRIVPAEIFLDEFASDRSHMIVQVSDAAESTYEGAHGSAACDEKTSVRTELGDAPRYSMPPPAYPPLCGANARARGVKHNLLDAFVDMGAICRAGGGREDPGVEEAERTELTFGRVLDVAAFLDWVAGG